MADLRQDTPGDEQLAAAGSGQAQEVDPSAPTTWGPVSAAGHTGNVHARKKPLRKVDPEERLPFTDHLEELRWRIIYSIITVVIVFIPMFQVSEGMLIILRKPLPPDEKLFFGAVTGAFFVYLKIAFYSSLLISTPMIMYHVWEFIAPGLLQAERKYTKIFVFFGTLCFAAGAAFCYYVALPVAIPFLIGYGGETIEPWLNVQEYISFFFMIIIGFGIAFELPLALIILMATRVVRYETLARQRGYAIIGSSVAGAVLTPTQDPFNMFVLAIPLYLFYELSLMAGWIFFRNPVEQKVDENSEG